MSIVAEKAAGSGEASGPSEGPASADADGEAPAAEDGEAEGLTAWLADCEKAGATFVPPQEAATKAHAQAATEIGCIRRGSDAGIRALISCSTPYSTMGCANAAAHPPKLSRCGMRDNLAG